MFGRTRKPARPEPPARFELLLDGEPAPVELSFDGFRSLRISIRPEGLVRVRAPKGTSKAFILERLEAKAAWIHRHLESFRQRKQAAPPPLFEDGARLLHLGAELTLSLAREPRNSVRLEGERLIVVTRREPTPEAVRRLVEGWRTVQARELFAHVIRELLPRLDALGAPRPKALTIRAMKSRWGSCSRQRRITLNLHLVKAPLVCIEYVAAHELCHLLRHAHDARFYALLAAVMPDWKQRRALLAAQPMD